MRHVYLPILGLAVTLLMACQGQSQIPPTKTVSDYCDLSFPILLLKSELPSLSQESKRQIYSHNTVWEQLCSKQDSRRKPE